MPRINAKRKGSNNELKTIRYYEKQGFQCTKAGGSLGVWDIIAISANSVILLQVKSNGWPGTEETARCTNFIAPGFVTKIILRWDDYAREPKFRYL